MFVKFSLQRFSTYFHRLFSEKLRFFLIFDSKFKNRIEMKTILKTLLFISLAKFSIAQVGINADNSAPHSSAQLDVKSTTKAFYPPRMTTAQKNAIVSPQAGAVVFDNTLNQLSFYNGTSWVAAAGSGLVLPYNQSVSQFTGYKKKYSCGLLHKQNYF